MKTAQMSDPILNEDTRAFLQGFSDLQASMDHLSIPEQRRKIREMFVPPKESLEPVKAVEDRNIQGRHGNIPLRIITPKNANEKTVIVFFHRGGWVYGSNDESESLCRKLANQTHCAVVQVEYRLSPEHKFPVPLEDCYDAVTWVSRSLTPPKGSERSVIVCGESAGGNLAAAVSLIAKEKGPKIAAQILIYPVLTNDLLLERYEKSPDKYLLSYENMQWFWEQYLAKTEDGNKELASPIKAKKVNGLPRTMIITAEYDALCLEGKEFAEKLQKAGVDVVYKQYSNVIHGFLDIPIASPEKEKTLKDLRAFLETV